MEDCKQGSVSMTLNSTLAYRSLLRGANASTVSNMSPERKPRDLTATATLVNHLHVGLLLFKISSAENVDTIWNYKLVSKEVVLIARKHGERPLQASSLKSEVLIHILQQFDVCTLLIPFPIKPTKTYTSPQNTS